MPAGPMVAPRPGPTLAMAVAAPDAAVTKSRPSMPSATAKSAKLVTNRKKKLITDSDTPSGIGRLL